jgi:choline dehydrogenase
MANDLDFDYVVVGAGTAGTLLANRLSADASKQVLLLEAGGPDNYPWIHIPVGYLYCIDNPRTDWRFRTEPDAGLNGRSLLYPRGKTLGGCSSINGMIYMRGQQRDYESWAAITGDADWGWDAALKDFKAHEDYHGLDRTGPSMGAAASNFIADSAVLTGATADLAKYHGHGGEWRIERQRLRWDILDAFAQAAVQAGIPATSDFNRGDNTGVGYFEVNQRLGWRWNTAKAFLRPVQGRRNLQVLTHAQAQRLVTQRGTERG